MTNEIITIIQTLGYPTAVSVALGIFIWRFTKNTQKDSLAREERLMKIIDGYNTQLSKISEILSGLQKDVEEIKRK
jgi:acetoacetate decarboxylase